TPQREKWKTIIAEESETIEGASVAAKQIYVKRLHDAHANISVHDLAGKKLRVIGLPGLGRADGFKGKPGDKELFYSFANFTTRTSVLRYDVATGTSKPLFAPKAAFEPSDFETRQVFFPSKDGTKVPMFITGKKGFALDGARPVIMTAY